MYHLQTEVRLRALLTVHGLSTGFHEGLHRANDQPTQPVQKSTVCVPVHELKGGAQYPPLLSVALFGPTRTVCAPYTLHQGSTAHTNKTRARVRVALGVLFNNCSIRMLVRLALICSITSSRFQDVCASTAVLACHQLDK
jgi:hypothetical protein